MHSSQDVCDPCEKTIAEFQRDFTDYIRDVLCSLGYGIPDNKPNTFKIVFRASSSREPTHSDYRVSLEKRDERLPLARNYTHAEPMDLRSSDRQLLLHSDSQMQDAMASWYVKDSYRGLTIFTPLLKQIVFRSRYGISFIMS